MTTITSHSTGETLTVERHGHQPELAQRASSFAQNTRTLVRRIPKTIASMGDCRRVIRSSGEIGSSYLDADRALSKSDFVSSIADCCREARQSQHWLRLLDVNLDDRSKELHDELVQEATELEKIFGAILQKTRAKK